MNLPDFKRQPSILKATFHINSPMFVAGAEQSKAEFTPTAFKGVLRFWWRALNWSQIRLASENKEQALKELHRKEGLIFGVSASDGREGMGQGGCLVNLDTTLQATDKKSQEAENILGIYIYQNRRQEDHWGIRKGGLGYLLGQGIFNTGKVSNKSKGLSRSFIQHGQTFSVELTVFSQYQNEIIDTLKLIGLLGGFGSRSRHGFGSVTLLDIEKKQLDTGNDFSSLNINVSNAVECLQNLLNKYQCFANTELPPLSAFYADSRIDVVTFNSDDSLELLNKVGEELQLYRSWGNDGKVSIRDEDGKFKDAERNFKKDHDLMLDYIDRKPQLVKNPIHPLRVVFGLPHAYRYSSTGDKIRADAQIPIKNPNGKEKLKDTRRASPLIQHIHKSSQGYQLVHCLLKSEFLHTKGSIVIKNKTMPANVDWTVITKFMDRDTFANKTTVN